MMIFILISSIVYVVLLLALIPWPSRHESSQMLKSDDPQWLSRAKEEYASDFISMLEFERIVEAGLAGEIQSKELLTEAISGVAQGELNPGQDFLSPTDRDMQEALLKDLASWPSLSPMYSEYITRR